MHFTPKYENGKKLLDSHLDDIVEHSYCLAGNSLLGLEAAVCCFPNKIQSNAINGRSDQPDFRNISILHSAFGLMQAENASIPVPPGINTISFARSVLSNEAKLTLNAEYSVCFAEFVNGQIWEITLPTLHAGGAVSLWESFCSFREFEERLPNSVILPVSLKDIFLLTPCWRLCEVVNITIRKILSPAKYETNDLLLPTDGVNILKKKIEKARILVNEALEEPRFEMIEELPTDAMTLSDDQRGYRFRRLSGGKYKIQRQGIPRTSEICEIRNETLLGGTPLNPDLVFDFDEFAICFNRQQNLTHTPNDIKPGE